MRTEYQTGGGFASPDTIRARFLEAVEAVSMRTGAKFRTQAKRLAAARGADVRRAIEDFRDDARDLAEMRSGHDDIARWWLVCLYQFGGSIQCRGGCTDFAKFAPARWAWEMLIETGTDYWGRQRLAVLDHVGADAGFTMGALCELSKPIDLEQGCWATRIPKPWYAAERTAAVAKLARLREKMAAFGPPLQYRTLH